MDNAPEIATPNGSKEVPWYQGQSSQTSKFELRWPRLDLVNDDVSDKHWASTAMPNVLPEVPQNFTINVRLSQILKWSMQYPEPSSVAVLNDTSSQSKSKEAVPDPNGRDSQDLLLEDDLTTQNQTQEALSRASPRSKVNKIGLFDRLKQIRDDVASKVAAKGSASTHATDRAGASSAAILIQMSECTCCFDEHAKTDLVQLSCSHNYCKPCLRQLVLNAMKNETAFPAKCCHSEIPLKTVLICLDSQQREEYKEKSEEFSVPAGHRWYCPEPTCSKWIKPSKLHRERRNHQTCPHCKAKICSICRSLAHSGNQECPQDFGLEATLEVAEAEGWQRCYSCRTMVELNTGCRHITCRCGAEFCYVCNARWKTCSCTENDKDRKLESIRTQRLEREQRDAEAAQLQAEEDAAAQAEAEEVAEAIRMVEEMEAQDAIRRAEEERQRQLEEELALALLEEERILEEIRKRDEEEAFEKKLKEVLLDSSREECQSMMKTLMQIITYQQTTLTSAHTVQEQNCLQEKNQKVAHLSVHATCMSAWLEDNIQKRRTILHNGQRQEWELLLKHCEEEEDDLFMHMTMHLRDKPNREQREKKMWDTLQQQQYHRHEALRRKHELENQKLEYGIEYEREGMKKWDSTKFEPVEEDYNFSLQELGRRIGCERRWFQIVSRRRIEMLKEQRRLVLEQVEEGQEPVGLTQHLAESIQPQLPRADSEIDTEAASIDAPSDIHEAPGQATPVQRPQIPASTAQDLHLPDASQRNWQALTPADQISSATLDTLYPLPASLTNTLTRSDTISHHIPGAYPSSKAAPNRHTYPRAAQPSLQQREPQKHNSIAVNTQTPGIMSMSFAVQASNDLPTALSQQPPTRRPSRKPVPEQAAAGAGADTIEPFDPIPSTLKPPLTTHTPLPTASKTTNPTSTADAITPLPPRDLSISTTATTASAISSQQQTPVPRSVKAKRLSVFGSLLGARKEMGEEEMKRKMRACVGDGFGS